MNMDWNAVSSFQIRAKNSNVANKVNIFDETSNFFSTMVCPIEPRFHIPCFQMPGSAVIISY
jgi:phospholipase C